MVEKAAVAAISGSFLEHKLQTGSLWAEDDLQTYFVLQSECYYYYYYLKDWHLS